MSTSFDSTKKPLKDMLRDVEKGVLQLPDFQRGWVWDDQGIRSLLASVSQSFPIGAVMTLKSGGDVRFKPRPIESVPLADVQEIPDEFLLDGQQRLTSLYQTIKRDELIDTVNVKQRKIKRWYYIDMKMALDSEADREDAIVGVPEDRIIRENFGRDVVLDLSSPEKEFENLHFPINRILSPNEWQKQYSRFWKHDEEKIEFWYSFNDTILTTFNDYHLPVITLAKETPKQAVCLVFEKVNTGGKKLDAFELVTAIYAADDFNLRNDWYGSPSEKITGRLSRLTHNPVLKEIANTDFLQSISLVHTREKRVIDISAGKAGKEASAVNAQRSAILDLPLPAYKSNADAVERGFERAARFLRLQKFYWFKDVPYRSQIVPLATILNLIGDDWEKDAVRAKLIQWFWCGVFGELYGSAAESRFARDAWEVPVWLDGGEEPSTIRDATFRADRLDTMRTRLSAAYKGVHALLMREGALDFRSGQPFDDTVYWDENVDIHHVFPQDWCKKNGIPKERYDSIINKSPISARTNRIIGGVAPSDYLNRLSGEASINPERLDECISSHGVQPELMRADDFDGFFDARREALLTMIESAMGKAAFRGTKTNEAEEDFVSGLEFEAAE